MAETKERFRIVFMGTPELAATVLRAVAAWPAGEIVAVYTQPDRPAGRGHKLTPSPVKVLARSLGIACEQPLNFRAEETRRTLAGYRPDFLLVAAYGLLLPRPVIETPRFPPLNVHTSLLPRYRGAAPIQRALMENWEENAQSGVSIMEIVQELDAGPVYAREALSLAGHTGGTLHDALAHIGGRLLVSVLDQCVAGTAHATPQDERQATYAPKISKADGHIDWNAPAAAIDARIRAVTPWPGARSLFHFDGREARILQLGPGKILDDSPLPGVPAGSVFWNGSDLRVACADAWYILGSLRPQGKKDMEASSFMNGFVRPEGRGCCGHAEPPA